MSDRSPGVYAGEYAAVKRLMAPVPDIDTVAHPPVFSAQVLKAYESNRRLPANVCNPGKVFGAMHDDVTPFLVIRPNCRSEAAVTPAGAAGAVASSVVVMVICGPVWTGILRTEMSPPVWAMVRVKSTVSGQGASLASVKRNGVALTPVAPIAMSGYADVPGSVTVTPGVDVLRIANTPVAF